MAGVKTPGITVGRYGRRIVDKEHRGVRIYARLRCASQAEAEERLALEIERVDRELDRKANACLRFADGAARYLKDSANNRSLDVTAWHVRLMIPYTGTLELDRIHDSTLQRFIARSINCEPTADIMMFQPTCATAEPPCAQGHLTTMSVRHSRA